MVFGNIEMIYAFHFNYFLKELIEQASDCTCPQTAAINIANCFLSHVGDSFLKLTTTFDLFVVFFAEK